MITRLAKAYSIDVKDVFTFFLFLPCFYVFNVFLYFFQRFLLVRPKTIVFGRTYVLAQMFFLSSRDLRDVWTDRREILHDGQY